MSSGYYTQAPPAGRRPRRRRRGLGWLIALVVVIGLLIAADRVAVVLADKAVAQRLAGQSPFTTAPSVSAEGFPFLTQAIGGTYDDIRVSGTGLQLGDLQDVDFRARLQGVHIPLSSVVGGHIDQVPVDRADGTVVIPYAQFAAQTGINGLTITESGGRLTVAAPIRLDIVDRSFDVVADGTIGLAGQDLDLTVDNIRVAGVSLPGFVVNALSDALNAAVTLPALPYGLQLQSVQAEGDGLHVSVQAANLTISTS